MKDNIEIIVDDERWEKEAPEEVKNSAEIFAVAVNYLRENNELDFLPDENMPISINLCLSNDDEVHALNKEFRNMDKPTNVLSFANIDDDNFENELQNSDAAELGDIIISLDTMQKEAKIENITFAAHYAHLLVHGILHLCGFDHIEDDEAEYMEGLEVKILNLLNIENPYKEEQ